MVDDVLRKPRLPKTFAPRRERDIAISDGPAERLGEDARIVVQIGRFRARQIVDLSDMRCGVVEDCRYRKGHIDCRDRRRLAVAHRAGQLVGSPHTAGERKKKALEEDCRPTGSPDQDRACSASQCSLCCGLPVVSVMLICVTVICDMFTKAWTP